MAKRFNVTGNCIPERHYMVDITDRLNAIKTMIDDGDYFTINRARQYGKTTTLRLLAEYLKAEYTVVCIDFQNLDFSEFSDIPSFVSAFAREFYIGIKGSSHISESCMDKIRQIADCKADTHTLRRLFLILNECCAQSVSPIVLIIDEVDTASDFQVFLDFLAQLRSGYINRDMTPTFQSIILAGVQDIRNIKQKLRSESEHQPNSPWNTRADNEENECWHSFDDCPRDYREHYAPYNIASRFSVDMSFSAKDIAGMLRDYEADHATGMNIDSIAKLIYDYTSGYPVLVSDICKYMDEEIVGTGIFMDKTSVWTPDGVVEAVSRIYDESNTLFESLQDKLNTYPDLHKMLYFLLMEGEPVIYNRYDPAVQTALMYGFIRIENKTVVVANRIFETQLYDTFLTSPEMRKSEFYLRGDREKYEFVKNGVLNMELILQRFVTAFDDLYGDRSQHFLEDDGRRYFLLYLRPIINGVGNYYIESRTRNQERTDVIIDYLGRQYVCELKIWRGNAYHERGEKQLTDYLDYYHLDKGYMLSFSFNKNKKIGVREIRLGEKVLVEAVV